MHKGLCPWTHRCWPTDAASGGAGPGLGAGCWPEGQAVKDARGSPLVLGMDTSWAAFASSLFRPLAPSLTLPALGFWCVFAGEPALHSTGHTAARGPILSSLFTLLHHRHNCFYNSRLVLVLFFIFLSWWTPSPHFISALLPFSSLILPFPQRGATTCIWCLRLTCGAWPWQGSLYITWLRCPGGLREKEFLSSCPLHGSAAGPGAQPFCGGAQSAHQPDDSLVCRLPMKHV